MKASQAGFGEIKTAAEKEQKKPPAPAPQKKMPPHDKGSFLRTRGHPFGCTCYVCGRRR